MWSRIVSGSFICLVGLVWIAQGTNVLHGSGMSGHDVWAVVGAVVVLLGVAMFVWAWRIRNRTAE